MRSFRKSRDAVRRADSFGVRGFTLMEMMVVIILIGMITAVALPQIMPALVFSRLEGAARHLAGYGRSAIAQCVLMRESLTVQFDVKNGEYWATHIVVKKDEEDTRDTDKDSGKNSKKPADLVDLMGREDQDKVSDEEMQNSADLQRTQFDTFARMQLMARSKQVNREGFLDDINPLADVNFKLDDKGEEVEEEVMDPMLLRSDLPEGVTIDSIRIGSDVQSSGEVQVEMSPLGLGAAVVIYLRNEDDDYYTVVWDPVTGGSRAIRGKVSAESRSG